MWVVNKMQKLLESYKVFTLFLHEIPTEILTCLYTGHIFIYAA